MARELTVGIAGAAGDGLDKTGVTLARSAARLGLHRYTYNSYQSLIRGGHTWLRLRFSEEEVYNHGDPLNVVMVLGQDGFERHAPEVRPGGAIIFNSSKVEADAALVPEGVALVPLPVTEMTQDMGKVLPVMQNTALLGGLLHLIGFDIEVTVDLLVETFARKSPEIIEQNVTLLQAGFEHAAKTATPIESKWNFSRKRRPLVTGNMMTALGAVAGGCKFYAAYPMSPASAILHWLADHSEQVGVVVKQAEDELAVINLAIGAGHAGVRAMCATSGGGFALMTEAIGMAGMIETPVVVVNVSRGGPSTGLPTKSEQGDLNQAFGASQGDYPRVIIAPKTAEDCYYSAAQALNLAEIFQLPVIIVSDLLLAEHRSTLDADRLTPEVGIERGEWVSGPTDGMLENGGYKRYLLTPSGISPRARPGTEDMIHVSGTDDHDEHGVLISDEHSNAAIRRKMHEKRMRKMAGVLASLPAPELEGLVDADVTLIGWGSTWGVIQEAVSQLNCQGIATNQLHFKYLYPLHEKEAQQILDGCKTTIVVENNFSGQFRRHLRAETGFTADHLLTRYDGEPFEPDWIVKKVTAFVSGIEEDLQVQESEAREIAYHFIRVNLRDRARPGSLEQNGENDYGEPTWEVAIEGRADRRPAGTLIIGMETGSIHAWQPATAPVAG